MAQGFPFSQAALSYFHFRVWGLGLSSLQGCSPEAGTTIVLEILHDLLAPETSGIMVL